MSKEKQRLEQIQHIELGLSVVSDYVNKTGDGLLNLTQNARLKRTRSNNICKILDERNTGLHATDRHIQSSCLESVARNLNVCARSRIFQDYSLVFNQLEHCNFMLPTKDSSQFLCVWSLRELITKRMQLLDVEYKIR